MLAMGDEDSSAPPFTRWEPSIHSPITHLFTYPSTYLSTIHPWICSTNFPWTTFKVKILAFLHPVGAHP